MPKPMTRRNVEKALRTHGATFLRAGGNHDVWQCPCGQHKTAVPRHNQITAGVVGSISKTMECLPKGWLQ